MMNSNNNEIIHINIEPDSNTFEVTTDFLLNMDSMFKVRFFNLKGNFIKDISNFVYNFNRDKLIKECTINTTEICTFFIINYEKSKESKVYCPPKEVSNTSLCYATKLAKEILDKSDKKGLEKYGRLLDDNLDDNFLSHAIDEAGDLLKYLVHTKESLAAICASYPNDQDLGKLIRKIYG